MTALGRTAENSTRRHPASRACQSPLRPQLVRMTHPGLSGLKLDIAKADRSSNRIVTPRFSSRPSALVGQPLRRADRGADRGLERDTAWRAHADRGADRLGQDARRLPDRDRPAVPRGGRSSAALPDEVRVIYVSPLKALSADIHKNLAEPRREIQRSPRRWATRRSRSPPRCAAATRRRTSARRCCARRRTSWSRRRSRCTCC